MTVVVERPETQVPSSRPQRRPWGSILIAMLLTMGLIVFGAVAGTDIDRLEPNQLLTTSEDGTVSLLDAETGEWVYDIPNARISADNSVIYQASSDGVKTVVAEMRATNAQVTWSHQLPGDLQVQVVASQGGAVALMDHRPARGLYVPEPREITNIHVVWTDNRPWRRYRLEGNFEPEAFSLSGETLFLLEFLPANNPTSYEVARLDLKSGELMESYAPSLEIETWMRGHARDQIVAPSGEYIYTLYSINPGDEKIQSDDPDNPTLHNAFVHVIDLETEESVCIFLPIEFGASGNVGLALSPDGNKMVAFDFGSGHGLIVDVDPVRHEVVGTWPGGHMGRAGVIANDGRIFLAYDSVVSEYAAEGRIPSRSLPGDSLIQAMDVSADGRYLRVVDQKAVRMVDLINNVTFAVATLATEAGRIVIGPPPVRTGFEVYSCAC